MISMHTCIVLLFVCKYIHIRPNIGDNSKSCGFIETGVNDSADKFYLISLYFLQFLYQTADDHGNVIPLTAKLFNLNFHPLEAVPRWRDPQLQVSENYSDLTKLRSTFFQILLIGVTCLKGGT